MYGPAAARKSEPAIAVYAILQELAQTYARQVAL
jgi:hypothetical protein